MTGFALRKQQNFDWNGVAYRIDRINADGGVLIERLTDGNMQVVPGETLMSGYVKGQVQASQASERERGLTVPCYSRPLKELPSDLRDAVARRMAYVKGLIERDGGPSCVKEIVEQVIHEIAAGLQDLDPPSASSVYRWYSRYRATRDVRSLVPRFDRRGSCQLHQSEAVLELLAQATEEAFRVSPRATCDDVFIRLKGKILQVNRLKTDDDALLIPSRRTVARLLQNMEFYDQMVLKEGKAAAERHCRINRKGAVSARILERVEVDHTPLDLFLIDDQTWLPLGRPVLTVLIDHFSKMPLGYYLSYGGTSAAAVMGAFRHAVLPKKPARRVLNRLKTDHAWPCFGVPEHLIADNGLEFHGADLDNVLYDLGTRIQYCPKRTPRFKGVIERYLKTINYYFAHQLPGTSMARLAARGDYDSSANALLTLAEFTQVLEKWILDVYAQTVHRGIKTTPWQKWQDGLQYVAPELPDNIESLEQCFGLVAERSLRRDGLWLNNLRYSDANLERILLKFGEGVRVRVLFDPEDLGSIRVWAPGEQQPVRVKAADYDYAKGLNRLNHGLICQKIREAGAEAEDRDARDRAKYEIAQEIEALMYSRKQQKRRQSAQMRGLTSIHPDSEPANFQPTSKASHRFERKGKPPAPANLPEVLPTVLPSFRIPVRRNGHE